MHDDNKNFVGGLVVGSVLGVILGIIIAPDSGEKTRQKLKNKFSDLKEYLTEEIGVVANKVKGGTIGKNIKTASKKRK